MRILTRSFFGENSQRIGAERNLLLLDARPQVSNPHRPRGEVISVPVGGVNSNVAAGIAARV